jgi:hypothetical protein
VRSERAVSLGERVHAIDRFKRRHGWAGFPFAVVKKYGDDQAGYLAALVDLSGRAAHALCAEINVVRARRLWPRGLVQPPFTEADQRAMRAGTLVEQRRPEQQITVTFETEETFRTDRSNRARRGSERRLPGYGRGRSDQWRSDDR